MYLVEISELLDLIGMSRKLKGFNFCRHAISQLSQAEYSIQIDSIYVNVSKCYLTDVSNVERNIRYAIEKTWETGDIDKIYELFGYTVNSEKGKPTNKEFLFMLADRIKILNKDKRLKNILY